MNERDRYGLRFYVTHEPTGRLLGTYRTSSEAREAKEAFEREDRRGARRGEYRTSYTFLTPPVEPHRFELGMCHGTFGPICSVCGLPADVGPHPNREEAWKLFEENF